jgi:hypothetical protein
MTTGLKLVDTRRTGVVSNAAIHGAKEDAKDEAKEHGVGENQKKFRVDRAMGNSS